MAFEGFCIASKVLIVDDEPKNRELLVRMLCREGYIADAVTNGSEALSRVRLIPPDLVVMDVLMPGMSGLQTCEAMRKDICTRSVPVILVTARGTLEDRLQGFQAGADDYVTKPFERQERKARIVVSLERNRRDLWCNPLARLPGNPAIEENVKRRLGQKEVFAFAYLDIDFFKAYNDAYGYNSGDQVIRHVSTLLMDMALQENAATFFPGHVGGDDFVFISPIETMHRELSLVLERFDQDRLHFYREEHCLANVVEVVNRMGQKQSYPLMTISAAIVIGDAKIIPHYGCLAERAGELKRYLKGTSPTGSSRILWDRRTYKETTAESEPGARL